MVKFNKYVCRDDQVLHREAFSILVPEGWFVSGGLIWRQHPTMPGAVDLTVKSPDGQYALSFFPSMPYCCNRSPFGFMQPEGSYYLGNEVRRVPQSYLAYIQQYILPRLGMVKIMGQRPFPELEQILRQENGALPMGCTVETSAGVASMQYGAAFKGEIICGILACNMMAGQTTWIADKMMMTRSPIDTNKGDYGWIFPVMLNSFKFDIDWYNAYVQYTQMLSNQVMQGIYQAGVRSRIIANANNYISDSIRRSYEYRQASNARVYQGFSEAMRGVNSYYDPYKGYAVEFPVDYRYVYANPLGEYIVTNDPNYNPNVGSNLNWTILNR